MSIYKTKQKEEIISIFNNHSSDILTAQDIKNESIKNGYSIGLTTIYRNLNDLVQRGILKKYIRPSGEAEYSLMNNRCSSHFHLKCKKCGIMIHLSCDEIDKMYNHILDKHKFVIDYKDTTIVGLCENCVSLGE